MSEFDKGRERLESGGPPAAAGPKEKTRFRQRLRADKFRLRRQRTRRKNVRLIHLLPNILTCLNLTCGVCAIIFAHEHKYEIAALLILMAGFFDMIDGKVARLVGASSPFGVQLDSLADLISFGAAPPILIHTMLFENSDRLSLSLVLVYTLCTALRLARYNVKAMGEQQKREFFTGLPCPAPAVFLASLVLVLMDFSVSPAPAGGGELVTLSLFGHPWSFGHPAFRFTFHVLMVVLACLMVSTVPFPDPSTLKVKKRDVYHHTVLIVMAFCVAVLIIKHVILFATLAFILSGPAMALRQRGETGETAGGTPGGEGGENQEGARTKSGGDVYFN